VPTVVHTQRTKPRVAKRVGQRRRQAQVVQPRGFRLRLPPGWNAQVNVWARQRMAHGWGMRRQWSMWQAGCCAPVVSLSYAARL